MFIKYDLSELNDPYTMCRYLAYIGIHAKIGKNIRCPLHDDRHASMKVNSDGTVHCFGAGCRFHGNALKLHRELNPHLSIADAIQELGQMLSFRTLNDDRRPFRKSHSPLRASHKRSDARDTPSKDDLSSKTDKSIYGLSAAYTLNCHKDFTPDCEAAKYLAARGIDFDTANSLFVGFDKERNAVVFPITATDDDGARWLSSKSRSITDKVYRNQKGTKRGIFNAEALFTNNGRIIVTEGEIDAVTLIAHGVKNVIAVPGAGNWHYVIDAITSMPRYCRPLFVDIFFDNDPSVIDEETGKEKGMQGQREAAAFAKELGGLGIIVDIVNRWAYDSQVKIDVDGKSRDLKDINEIAVHDPHSFQEIIDAFLQTEVSFAHEADEYRESIADDPNYEEANDFDNLSLSIGIAAFDDAVAKFNSIATIKTGFSNLDNESALWPGIYVLGAIPSLGKTTFALQLMLHLTLADQPVIFFSYEMSRFQLHAKLIACQSHKLGLGVSALQIMRGVSNPCIKRAKDDIIKHGCNSIIIEADQNFNVDSMHDVIDSFVKRGLTPVVIVDYLQLVPPNTKSSTSNKDAIDDNFKRIRQLQREFGIFFLLISSFNRMNYTQQVDFESFKESGGIEYGADVLWGMQLYAINAVAKAQANVNEARIKLMQAKTAIPRLIELKSLKNRFGVPVQSYFFKYFADHDFFEAADLADMTSEDDNADDPDLADMTSEDEDDDANNSMDWR